MKAKSIKCLSALLAFALAFGLFSAIPAPASADSATTLRNEIIGWNHTGVGTLNATVTGGNTVIVTSDGPVTGANNGLALNISAGVKVIWQADFSGSRPAGSAFFAISGKGVFEVAEGGKIKNDGPGTSLILSSDPDSQIVVSGGTVSAKKGTAIVTGGGTVTVTGGTVQSTGDGGRAIALFNDSSNAAVIVSGGSVVSDSGQPTIYATSVEVRGGYVRNMGSGDVISASKSVTVSGGAVSANSLSAIYMNSANASVKVSGGTVENVGSGWSHAICTGFANSIIDISGGTIRSIGEQGTVRAKGQATVNINGGEVSASAGWAIITDGPDTKVTIGGNAIVSATGIAVFVNGGGSTIETRDNATVKSSEHHAIRAASVNSLVRIQGGTVDAPKGNAIAAAGDVIINGGSVSSTSLSAIIFEAKSVTINGGTVSAKSGVALRTALAGATININGGFVFAYGTGIYGSNNVIDMAIGTPGVNTPAVVCVWNNPGGSPSYAEGSTEAISVLPVSASAKWGKSGALSGISYVNGANTGFFPIEGVTVNSALSAFTVTFNTNGGSALASQTVNPGGKAAKPANPTKSGFTFDGWYTDSGLTAAYDFDSVVTASITLYAKWAAGAASSPVNVISMKINDPYMYVNGDSKEIDPGRGTAPMIISARTLVPIRAIVEAMGGAVGFEAETRTITLTANGRSVVMWLDKTNLVADGASKTMDVAPVSINGRTMVPVRFAAENLGCNVQWLDATREIIITY